MRIDSAIRESLTTGIQSRHGCLNPDHVGITRSMAAPSLDWSSAQVRDATLEIVVTGERPKGWRKSAQRTVRLLGSGDWDEVSVRKGTVRVTGVSAGQEERLRHFLESVVEQANADHSLPGEADGPESEAGSQAPPGPDAEMTERFRSFAAD